ncbi:hypothetical protein ACFPTO_20100 [Paraburkholderia denitrificans]|uniref:Uncharacterized protein n=1 Tax=Paraburkholderia denitrificans TaxID=694025 RepID=A0ABW0JE05_9BURK
MSYDLFFTLPADITKDDVAAYFRQRSHYRVDGNATYENTNTGVYFSFAFDDAEPTNGQSAGAQRRIAFNLNYFRPHIFGLEAEPEVSLFVNRFNPEIEDPQVQGMAAGPYSAEGFLRGWNCGNEVAYESIIESHSRTNNFLTMSEAVIEAAWRWNYEVPTMQAALGQSVFVPKIMMLNIEGEAKSSVVWGDGIPTLLPEVDIVFVYRDELAPKPLLGKREKDHCLIVHSQLDEVLEPLSNKGYPLPVRTPIYVEAPKSVSNFVRKLQKHTGALERVAMDRVLSRELFEKSPQ